MPFLVPRLGYDTWPNVMPV